MVKSPETVTVPVFPFRVPAPDSAPFTVSVRFETPRLAPACIVRLPACPVALRSGKSVCLRGWSQEYLPQERLSPS